MQLLQVRPCFLLSGAPALPVPRVPRPHAHAGSLPRRPSRGVGVMDHRAHATARPAQAHTISLIRTRCSRTHPTAALQAPTPAVPQQRRCSADFPSSIVVTERAVLSAARRFPARRRSAAMHFNLGMTLYGMQRFRDVPCPRPLPSSTAATPCKRLVPNAPQALRHFVEAICLPPPARTEWVMHAGAGARPRPPAAPTPPACPACRPSGAHPPKPLVPSPSVPLPPGARRCVGPPAPQNRPAPEEASSADYLPRAFHHVGMLLERGGRPLDAARALHTTMRLRRLPPLPPLPPPRY